MSDPDTGIPPPTTQNPGLFRYVLGFLLVGAAWGLTTPFMRRAALNRSSSSSSIVPPSRVWLTERKGVALSGGRVGTSVGGTDNEGAPYRYNWVKRTVWTALYAVYDLLRNPAYAVPFVINITGSVWFFLLIGQAELSLTVPIVNSLAFLFTVLGEWWADGKVIERDTWLGIAFVLGGITLCVHAKNT